MRSLYIEKARPSNLLLQASPRADFFPLSSHFQDLAASQEEAGRTRGDAAEATRRLAAALGHAGSAADVQEARAGELSRSLDGAAYALRLEARRSAMHVARIGELEAEVAALRLRGAGDAAEAAAAAESARVASAAAAAAGARADAAERRAARARAAPDAAAARLRADNARLVALLEATPEYKSLLADLSLGGRHYIGLSEVILEQGVTSERVTPLRDRPLPSSFPGSPPAPLEMAHWVPRDAVALAHAFIARLHPRGVPAAPFMQLLLELNTVWKAAFEERAQALAKRHEGAMEALRRQVAHRQPYAAVLAEGEMARLRKLLKAASGAAAATTAMGRPLERMREAASRAGSDEARLLLEWGLSTIERLAAKLNELTEANLELRRRLMGGGEEASVGGSDADDRD